MHYFSSSSLPMIISHKIADIFQSLAVSITVHRYYFQWTAKMDENTYISDTIFLYALWIKVDVKQIDRKILFSFTLVFFSSFVYVYFQFLCVERRPFQMCTSVKYSRVNSALSSQHQAVPSRSNEYAWGITIPYVYLNAQRNSRMLNLTVCSTEIQIESGFSTVCELLSKYIMHYV